MPSRPVRLLFLIESLAGGGAEKVLADMVRGLDRDRFDVTVQTIVDCGLYRDDVRRHVHYRTIVNGKGWLYRLKYALIYRLLPDRFIYNRWIGKDYDIEVAFTEGLPTRLLAAAPEDGVRRVAWVHVDLEARPWTQGQVFHSLDEEKRAYARFCKVVHVSQTVREAFERRFGAHPGSVVLHNPVRQDRVRRLAAAGEGDVPPKRHFRLVSVGRFEEQKGFDRLLRALARARDRGWEAELILLGEGSQRTALEAQAAQLGIADLVRMPGFRGNPFPWVASADLFVCSSRSEGMSTVVTEAMILGVPVLATECSGIREQLGDGAYGLIVPNDDDALAGGVADFLSGCESCAAWRERSARGGREVAYDRSLQRVQTMLEGLI